MYVLKTSIIFLFILFVCCPVQAQLRFSSLDSLLNYATTRSLTLRQGEIRVSQARKARLAALLSVADPTGTTSFTYTDNTQLPVSLFPGEVFGQPAGTYKEVKTGIQYVSNFNENVDIKIINPAGWENLRQSKINLQAVVTGNTLTLKSLFENMADAWFNVLSLQEQYRASQQNEAVADTLLQVVENKFEQGLVKQQDVNEAKISQLNTRESTRQIAFLLYRQYLSLKILADLPDNDSLTVAQVVNYEADSQEMAISPNLLEYENSLLKEKLALSTFRKNKQVVLPVFSVFASHTRQQYNPDAGLFASSVRWFPSTYLGFKLNLPMPNATSVSQVFNAKYEYQLAQQTSLQSKIKADATFRQLGNDYAKARSQARTNQEIYRLRKENYEKNQTLYQQGIASLNTTLNSFNDLVNSRFTYISSVINVLLSQSKVSINNRIR